MKIADVEEGRCQEASMFSKEEYIPCNEPATHRILQPDGNVLRMCDLCADHNVRNRGAKELL